MVGVITEVTMKIVPKFNIYAETQPVRLDELFVEKGINDWEKVARENEWFSILWLLNTEWATVFSGIKATSATRSPQQPSVAAEAFTRNLF